MKRTIFAVVLILCTFFGANSVSVYGQNITPVDIVLLLDTSAGMSSSYENVSNYLTGPFLSEFLRMGDTFHLISFSENPRLDVARRIFGVGDVETIIARMLLQYPVENRNNISGALAFAEGYVSTLPSRPKKIVLVTAGDSETGNLVTSLRQRLSSLNTTLDYIQITPGQPLSNLPSSGRPAVARTTAPAPAAVTATPAAPAATTTPPAVPAVTAPATPAAAATTQTPPPSAADTRVTAPAPAVTAPAAATTPPPAAVATTPAPVVVTAPAAPAATTTPPAAPAVTAPVTTVPEATVTPAAVAGIVAEPLDTGVSGQQQPAPVVSPPPAAVSSEPARPVTASRASQAQSGEPWFSSMPFVIGLIILALLLLGLIIFFASRKLGSPSSRAASPASKGKAADNSKDLANFASAQGKRTTPYDDKSAKPVVINSTGPLLLNLFVNDQSTAIGKRNIHSLKSGYSLSVGGSKSDDYLIFLVPIPAHVGDIRRNGSQLTFTPRKPKYFPDLGSNELKDCINKTIRIVSDKNYEVYFRFVTYEDPLEALNRVLLSMKVPS